jgi:hypothetical protein
MKLKPNLLHLAPGLVFLVGAGLGYLAWDYIRLPFSNPLEVVGPPTLQGWNPYDSILRFVIFIFLPPVLLAVLYFCPVSGLAKATSVFSPRREAPENKSNGKNFYFEFFLVLFAALLSLNIPTYHAFGRFDPFHEGESMGAAVSAMEHQVPYRDFYFFHGVIQDPIRSVTAFQWFGRSIGAQRTLESILKVLTWMFLALFLAKVFSSNRFYAVTTLISAAVFSIPFLFDTAVEPFVRPHQPENIVRVFSQWEFWLAPFHWMILTGRDLLPMAFLLAFLFLLEYARHPPQPRDAFKLGFSAFCFSFIPWLALAHSVDRGIYLTAAGFVFSAAFVFYFLKKRDSLRAYLGGTAAGLILGSLVLGHFLQWNYEGFVSFVFGFLPRYKLLTDSLHYPIHDFRFALVLFLLSFCFFRETDKLLRLIRFEQMTPGEALWVFFLEDGVQIALLTMGLFCFRNVLERPVLDHLAYNSIFIFLLIVFEFFNRFRVFFEGRLFRKMFLGILAFALALVVLSFYRLISFNQWDQNFPLKTPDDSFLSEDRRQVVAFLKGELKDGELFFAFTNDASWYYLLNRPSPTAYPCLWVAAPKVFQQQVVESLERNKIRIILYKNNYWGSSIDDIHDTERFPVITRYIQEYYVPYKKIADQEIWIRKIYFLSIFNGDS